MIFVLRTVWYHTSYTASIITRRTVRLRSPIAHAWSNDLSCIPLMMSWRTHSRWFSPVTSSTADSSITVLDILAVVMVVPFVLGTNYCFTPADS